MGFYLSLTQNNKKQMQNPTISQLALHHKKADEWYKHQVEFAQIYKDCLIDFMSCPADMYSEMKDVFLCTEMSYFAHSTYGVQNLFTVILN
jgi:hypothetical protein